MDAVSIVLDTVAKLIAGIYNLATAKTTQDRTAAFDKMKSDISAGEAALAALPADLAANDAAAQAALDAKFPPSTHTSMPPISLPVVIASTTPLREEPTVDLKAPPLKPVDDLK